MSRTLQDALNLYYEIRLQSRRFVDLKDFSLHHLAKELYAKPCMYSAKGEKGVMVFFILNPVTGKWLDLNSYCNKYEVTPGQIEEDLLYTQDCSIEHVFFKEAPLELIKGYVDVLNSYNPYEQRVEDYVDLTRMETAYGNELRAN
tara:strand:+ start:1814 stop:2248 length:435 start_codon:yes stop_codon:yes gene_type:complete